MKKILLAYDLPKETVIAIRLLYRNTKAKVHSPDGDTDFFDIIVGNKLALYLFINCLDYELRTPIDLIKENGFILKRQEVETITDEGYADDKALLANTPT